MRESAVIVTPTWHRTSVAFFVGEWSQCIFGHYRCCTLTVCTVLLIADIFNHLCWNYILGYDWMAISQSKKKVAISWNGNTPGWWDAFSQHGKLQNLNVLTTHWVHPFNLVFMAILLPSGNQPLYCSLHFPLNQWLSRLWWLPTIITSGCWFCCCYCSLVAL
jgi:hypothetical protein